jgi:ABC-type nitrate/sulfonate/bicarbonate transport system permease component
MWLSGRSIRMSSIALLLVLWEIMGLHLPPLFLSPFHATVVELWRLTADGTLVKATISSMQVLFAGLALSVLIGLVIGLILGRYRTLRVIFEPYINTLYATPMIAFLPLVTAWLGLFYAPKVVVVVLMAVFPILKNTLAGVANVSKELLEPAESMSASELQIFRKVIIPASLPFVLAGLRLSIGKGIVGVVVAEFLTAQTGLGGLVTQYAGDFQTAKMFAPVIIIVTIGVLLTGAMKWLQGWLTPWKETERDGGV